METQLFFVVYFPCYGSRGYRVFQQGQPYTASMGDRLEGVYYSRESAQVMADYLSDLRQAAEEYSLELHLLSV